MTLNDVIRRRMVERHHRNKIAIHKPEQGLEKSGSPFGLSFLNPLALGGYCVYSVRIAEEVQHVCKSVVENEERKGRAGIRWNEL